MERKQPTSFRLSAEALEHIVWLSRHLGVSQAGVLELLVRERVRSEKRKVARELEIEARIRAESAGSG